MHLVSVMKMNVFLKMDFGRAGNVSGEGVTEVSLQAALLCRESWPPRPPRLHPPLPSGSQGPPCLSLLSILSFLSAKT